MTIATGILNIWKQEPEDVAAWWHALSDDHKARCMLGIGVSHGPIIGETWGKPVAVMRDWISRALAAGIPAASMTVAALGPKMVAMAGELTAGVHPYLVTTGHTTDSRTILGPGKVIAVEQGVVLEDDPAKARELALEALVHYRRLPNYMNSWKRLGYSDADIADVSDNLLDGLFAMGSADAIAARVKDHHDCGADHVCIQAITGKGLDGARAAWRELAGILL